MTDKRNQLAMTAQENVYDMYSTHLISVQSTQSTRAGVCSTSQNFHQAWTSVFSPPVGFMSQIDAATPQSKHGAS